MKTKQTRRGSKTLYYFNRLTPDEIKDFRYYLESPLLGNSLQGVGVLEVLEEKRKEGPLTSLDPSWFTEVMNPDLPMSKKKIHYIWVRLSVFNEKMLEFISFMESREDPTASNRNLFNASKNRGWEKYLDSLFQKGIQEIPSPASAKSLQTKLELQMSYNEYLVGHAVKGMDTHLAQVLESIDSIFLLQKLKYGSAAFNLGLLGREVPELFLLEPVLDHIKAGFHDEVSIVKAYYHALNMLKFSQQGKEGSYTHFQSLASLLQNPQNYSREEAFDLFTYAQNYCILQIHQKQDQFLVPLKELYNSMLNSGVILEGGLLSQNFYKNTITLMCRVGEFDWVESFLESYRYKVSGDLLGLAYQYNRAVLEFHLGNFERVVSLLYHQIHLFEDILYGLGARIYLCKALWQQEDFDWLMDICTAFQQYLYRNKILLEEERDRPIRFVRYLIRIVKVRTGPPGRRKKGFQKIDNQLEEKDEKKLYPWLNRILAAQLEVNKPPQP